MSVAENLKHQNYCGIGKAIMSVEPITKIDSLRIS